MSPISFPEHARSRVSGGHSSEQRLAMRAREHPHEKTPFLRQDTPTIYGIFCEAVVSSQQLFDDYAVNTCSELYKIL